MDKSFTSAGSQERGMMLLWYEERGRHQICFDVHRVVLVANNNGGNDTSVAHSTGYSMLASCLDRGTVSCRRGGDSFRPCYGMGGSFTGICEVR